MADAPIVLDDDDDMDPLHLAMAMSRAENEERVPYHNINANPCVYLRDDRMPSGLFNNGVYCSFNVVAQLLFHLPGFRKHLYEAIPDAWIKEKAFRQFDPELQGSATTRHLVMALRRLFAYMDGSKYQYEDPKEIISIISDLLSQNRRTTPDAYTRQQQDSVELMEWLLPTLDNTLCEAQREKQLERTGVYDDDLLVKFFAGSMCTSTSNQDMMEELECREISLEYLDVKFKTFIFALTETSYFHHGSEKELYYSYDVNNLAAVNFYCLKRYNKDEKNSVFKIPETFFLDAYLNSNDKCWTIHEDLAWYFKSKEMHERNESDLGHFFRKVPKVTEYKLYSVIIHAGENIDNGHYYIYINGAEGWKKYNDISVTSVIWEDIQEDIYKHAYSVAYIRSNKDDGVIGRELGMRNLPVDLHKMVEERNISFTKHINLYNDIYNSIKNGQENGGQPLIHVVDTRSQEIDDVSDDKWLEAYLNSKRTSETVDIIELVHSCLYVFLENMKEFDNPVTRKVVYTVETNLLSALIEQSLSAQPFPMNVDPEKQLEDYLDDVTQPESTGLYNIYGATTVYDLIRSFPNSKNLLEFALLATIREDEIEPLCAPAKRRLQKFKHTDLALYQTYWRWYRLMCVLHAYARVTNSLIYEYTSSLIMTTSDDVLENVEVSRCASSLQQANFLSYHVENVKVFYEQALEEIPKVFPQSVSSQNRFFKQLFYYYIERSYHVVDCIIAKYFNSLVNYWRYQPTNLEAYNTAIEMSDIFLRMLHAVKRRCLNHSNVEVDIELLGWIYACVGKLEEGEFENFYKIALEQCDNNVNFWNGLQKITKLPKISEEHSVAANEDSYIPVPTKNLHYQDGFFRYSTVSIMSNINVKAITNVSDSLKDVFYKTMNSIYQGQVTRHKKTMMRSVRGTPNSLPTLKNEARKSKDFKN